MYPSWSCASLVWLCRWSDPQRPCAFEQAFGRQYPRHAGGDQHLPAALAVELADVARRRPAAAGVESHQLHAQLVEIAVAARVGLLDLDPQLVERHGFAHERAL